MTAVYNAKALCRCGWVDGQQMGVNQDDGDPYDTTNDEAEAGDGDKKTVGDGERERQDGKVLGSDPANGRAA